MTKTLFNLLLLLWVAFVIGCGTMSKEECASSEWKHIGLVDGRMGKTASYLNEHRNTCGENTPNAIAYEEGRIQGLKEYCTPRSA
jgi:hypothetical protein